jgi:hypothetical protein
MISERKKMFATAWMIVWLCSFSALAPARSRRSSSAEDQHELREPGERTRPKGHFINYIRNR